MQLTYLILINLQDIMGDIYLSRRARLYPNYITQKTTGRCKQKARPLVFNILITLSYHLIAGF